MPLTRRELLGGAAVSAAAASGLYELVDRLAAAPPRAEAAAVRPEQHVLDGQRVVRDNGVEVVVPPLHHQVLTAELRIGEDAASVREARDALEHALRRLEGRFGPTPSGLGVTVAWGLPYFRRYVPGQATRHLPVDRRASNKARREIGALEDAIRFPSDPDSAILEGNDIAILLRSDVLAHVGEGAKAIAGALGDALHVTSVRKGFAGGGFGGGRSLPKRMAMAARIPGAELIPADAELFLGFTSTQKAGLGPPLIANFETLGYVDLRRGGYFANGTHMHLSHLFEDVEGWYFLLDERRRVASTFRPGLEVRPGTRTVPQGPRDAQTAADVVRGYERHGAIGHSGSIQPTSRLAREVVGPDGTRYPAGTAVPQRADFNTLDNPFFWTARPERDGFDQSPSAGVHFVVFNPSSDDFRRNRLAMDGVLPDGRVLSLAAGSEGQGLNNFLQTTHRQNFLVPPRRHRSFPLAELRS